MEFCMSFTQNNSGFSCLVRRLLALVKEVFFLHGKEVFALVKKVFFLLGKQFVSSC